MSYPISVGHMVVRPALAGMMRRPYSAKKMALISSDLPRENSATNATMTLSERTRPSKRRKRSSTAASRSSWSFIHSANSFKRKANYPSRTAASARSASGAIETYHCGEISGSMTAPDRLDTGVWTV